MKDSKDENKTLALTGKQKLVWYAGAALLGFGLSFVVGAVGELTQPTGFDTTEIEYAKDKLGVVRQ